jgi:hypothetical protein
MSSTSVKVAIALFMVLATPAASIARVGAAGMGHSGGVGATGEIGGARPNAATLGALENMSVDPSGVGNAARVAAPPPPRITVPAIPQFK